MSGVNSPVKSPRYDEIGHGYARTRREDPRFRERIHAALGDARTVVNVGAGTGSYEPRNRHVIAVEPSDVMAGQRPPELSPAIRADAANLPLRDASVDAAMAVLTVHHWERDQERGLQEMRRVARGSVVIVTYDPTVSGEMWLMADYLPEVAQMDHRIFPALEIIAGWLGVTHWSSRCRFRVTLRTGHSDPSGLTPSASLIRMPATPHRALLVRSRRSSTES